MQFAAEAGYWPWAAIVTTLTVVIVVVLRRLYPTSG